ncbi:hypothetical protein [Noviherbaspirillum malthae]|uniref:hypothetical protein n=1 Tax=Noviherbaspirillum malthae TaxID=1260987 RepID=UPI00188FFB59|nr:hypothetical protein [Noviherbaspirillum malthae]
MTDITKIRAIAEACRSGLESLTNRAESGFFGFPTATCGFSAEIVGRLLKEKLNFDGIYVNGDGHPRLTPSQSHAWYEVGDYIIDITHDQFKGTGLSGWVFKRGEGWHTQFANVCRREGFCMPKGWPCYPFDGYQAALDEVLKLEAP